MKNNEYRETRRHGNAGFPIQLYSINASHPRYVMALHWHDEIEIIHITSGEFVLFLNNVKYMLKAGDIAVVNCKYLHRGEPFNAEYECVVCDLSMLAKKSSKLYVDYINPIISGDFVVFPFLIQNKTQVYNEICELFSAMQTIDAYYELKIISLLFSILNKLYSSGWVSRMKAPKSINSQSNMMAELIDWIENNYSEHITLKILSDKACVTPNYLCRIFKEYTKQTPIEYINSIRIENACFDIKYNHKTITEAASDSGFNDISYFCRVFKNQKGISAKKYIKGEF